MELAKGDTKSIDHVDDAAWTERPSFLPVRVHIKKQALCFVSACKSPVVRRLAQLK